VETSNQHRIGFNRTFFDWSNHLLVLFSGSFWD